MRKYRQYSTLVHLLNHSYTCIKCNEIFSWSKKKLYFTYIKEKQIQIAAMEIKVRKLLIKGGLKNGIEKEINKRWENCVKTTSC